MLTDTGFFCRHVLGMDTDRDANGNATTEVGKGGIRDWGPHKEMNDFLDDDSRKTAVLWAPRFSFKSSWVQGFLMRKILAHPNIAILLYMHDLEEAKERCGKIRDQLLTNPIIKELFPNIKGPTWKKDSFTTALRTDKTIQQPTLTVASPQKAKTGGRFHIILFDDIVSETNYLTESGRKKSIHCVQTSLALAAKGTRFMLIGTPYHQGDANHWVINAGWDRLTHLDVGCDLVVKDDGLLDLRGEARWPNLSIDFLRSHLTKGMPFAWFMSQFKLQVVTGVTQPYKREHFQVGRWSNDLDLTGYLLTDVAPSGSEKGDFNVLIYIGINSEGKVFVLDVAIGYWLMYEFCERYLDMIQKWNTKVTHRAELWEDSLNLHSYIQHLQVRGKARGVRPNPVTQRRNQTEKSKDERIASLALRFQAMDVTFMDTLPTKWSTGTEVRELWDAEGFTDKETKIVLPSGDLVDWFIQFPGSPKKDVPDCLALVDARDRVLNTPVCYYVKPSRTRTPETVVRKSNRTSGRRSIGAGSSSRFYDRYSRF